jgi:hypothetical protein
MSAKGGPQRGIVDVASVADPTRAAWMDVGKPLTAAERQALRADARETRERARAIAAESLRLRTTSKAQRMTADALVGASKELRDRLRAMVVKHARLTRALGETPEQAIVEVKTVASGAVDDVRASTRTFDQHDAQMLRDDLVRWTIDAYFGVGL